MKVSLRYLAASIAILLASIVHLRAENFSYPGLSDANTVAHSRQIGDGADSAKIFDCDDSGFTAQPRIQLFASLLYLKPGAGNLEYGTLVHPLPPASPHWQNQSIDPKFSPAFNVGAGYAIPDTANDLRASWTHLNTGDSASFAGTPTDFAGPSYLIGPGATAFNLGSGSVRFRYDAVNMEAGHLFQAGGPFQVRVFGGVQYATINQTIVGSFSDYAATNTQANTTDSKFSGAGPRLGVNAQFNRRRFQIVGDMAAVALIGSQRTSMGFNTTSPGFPGGNPQSFTSPNATQVVPGLDSRLGTSFSTQLGSGIFKIEAGYQVVVYVDAVNGYSLSQVATPPAPQSVGVFFATAQHTQSNFTAHGPYLGASWSF